MNEENKEVVERLVTEYNDLLDVAVNSPKNFQCGPSLEQFSTYKLREGVEKVCKLTFF